MELSVGDIERILNAEILAPDSTKAQPGSTKAQKLVSQIVKLSHDPNIRIIIVRTAAYDDLLPQFYVDKALPQVLVRVVTNIDGCRWLTSGSEQTEDLKKIWPKTSTKQPSATIVELAGRIASMGMAIVVPENLYQLQLMLEVIQPAFEAPSFKLILGTNHAMAASLKAILRHPLFVAHQTRTQVVVVESDMYDSGK